MPKITIDGDIIEVPDGRTLLQALDDVGLLMNGVDIPHYCWHPKLSIDGSCRLCQVEVEGMPKLQIACDTRVEDGMVVRTDSELVKSAREGVLELLLVNHPLDCPICDQAGECKLQDYSYDYGVAESRSREPRRALKKNVDLGPTIVFDQERCILCRRCTRFCDEVPGTGELVVVNRGDESRIETFPGQPLDNAYSMNVADLCPVGALTTRDFRFKVRVWFLEDVPGVCTGCSKGCNIHLGVATNKVHRYTPRRNDDVNDTWMCDAGRMTYAEIGGAHRLKQIQVRNHAGRLETVSFSAALEAAAARIANLRAGGGALAGLASPHATNEDLLVFRRLLDALGVEWSGVAVVRGEGDDILIQPEKAANEAGARALGFEDAAPVAAAIRNGQVSGLIILGHDVLDARYLGGSEALTGLETVIALDTHQSELQRVAHVIFPVRHAAEKFGTLTNHAGRVQRTRPAVEPSWEAHPEGAVLAQLGRALELPGFDGSFEARAVSRELGSLQSAFRGIDWDSVGEGGRMLSAEGS